ncbi:AzlD domain-containing protein [Mammaliicoccus sp. Dog046]|uniref:AzlD domain-containing protein n=1 Tax=Mammaliicoccus sp. Dog046 TaxID=3034233 RepID=UPI002B261C2F|nr:AzlD domain-containing protein [Mammaliicoccus sp. Dog046]WQK85482.1 AzlD domain-containing protein [Mammaliicoccus sp. Dog046]
MSISMYLIIIIIGCFAITWVIRVAPFILLAKLDLPNGVIKWLQFVPICLFTALIVEGMLNKGEGFGYTFNVESIVVAIPTIIIALVTKSLTISVIAGMIVMAMVRLLM